MVLPMPEHTGCAHIRAQLVALMPLVEAVEGLMRSNDQSSAQWTSALEKLWHEFDQARRRLKDIAEVARDGGA
jgi:predicted mannosyl-3-phosphoglycerate phosphatase (HAD superfamily)